MEFIDYIKAKNRMTKECGIHCDDCPLGGENNGTATSCRALEIKYPEKAVEIVEKWEKEYPRITRQSELLKLFPKALMIQDKFVNICPKEVDKYFKCSEHPCLDCRKKFWLEEVEYDEKVL